MTPDVQACHDDGAISFCAVVHRIRKASEQRAPSGSIDDRKHFGMACDLLEDDGDGAQEFVAQAAGLLLVPGEGVVKVRSGQRLDEHRDHLGFPARDVVEYVAPGRRLASVPFVGVEALIKDCLVFLGDGDRVRAGVLGDGVPDVLDELQALGDAESMKVKRGLGAHESRVARGWTVFKW